MTITVLLLACCLTLTSCAHSAEPEVAAADTGATETEQGGGDAIVQAGEEETTPSAAPTAAQAPPSRSQEVVSLEDKLDRLAQRVSAAHPDIAAKAIEAQCIQAGDSPEAARACVELHVIRRQAADDNVEAVPEAPAPPPTPPEPPATPKPGETPPETPVDGGESPNESTPTGDVSTTDSGTRVGEASADCATSDTEPEEVKKEDHYYGP